jgi:DNA-binding NtrC family response regulator
MGDGKSEQSEQLDLSGARVLLVEDEYYIADDLRRTLRGAGATVVGPASTLSLAMDLLDEGNFDCAVIDLNLQGESGLPLAERLMEQRRSFAIATGYGSPAIPERLRDVPRLEKPFDPPALLRLVGQLRCAKAA